MTASDDGLDGFLSPSDLAFLEGVVLEICPEVHCEGGEERASFIAAAAVELFQQGVNDRSVMVDRLRVF